MTAKKPEPQEPLTRVSGKDWKMAKTPTRRSQMPNALKQTYSERMAKTKQLNIARDMAKSMKQEKIDDKRVSCLCCYILLLLLLLLHTWSVKALSSSDVCSPFFPIENILHFLLPSRLILKYQCSCLQECLLIPIASAFIILISARERSPRRGKRSRKRRKGLPAWQPRCRPTSSRDWRRRPETWRVAKKDRVHPHTTFVAAHHQDSKTRIACICAQLGALFFYCQPCMDCTIASSKPSYLLFLTFVFLYHTHMHNAPLKENRFCRMYVLLLLLLLPLLLLLLILAQGPSDACLIVIWTLVFCFLIWWQWVVCDVFRTIFRWYCRRSATQPFLFFFPSAPPLSLNFNKLSPTPPPSFTLRTTTPTLTHLQQTNSQHTMIKIWSMKKENAGVDKKKPKVSAGQIRVQKGNASACFFVFRSKTTIPRERLFARRYMLWSHSLLNRQEPKDNFRCGRLTNFNGVFAVY